MYARDPVYGPSILDADRPKTPVAAATAFVLVTVGIWYYERRYAIAAAHVRERLG